MLLGSLDWRLYIIEKGVGTISLSSTLAPLKNGVWTADFVISECPRQ